MALENGKSYTYHYDGMGNTTELTDSTGAVTDTYRYNAWGEVISRTGTTKNPHTFVGKERYYAVPDAVPYLLGLRYYDSITGRWIGQDPLEDDVNLYRYVGNSATSGVDPSGLTKKLWLFPALFGQIYGLVQYLNAHPRKKPGACDPRRAWAIKRLMYSIVKLGDAYGDRWAPRFLQNWIEGKGQPSGITYDDLLVDQSFKASHDRLDAQARLHACAGWRFFAQADNKGEFAHWSDLDFAFGHWDVHMVTTVYTNTGLRCSYGPGQLGHLVAIQNEFHFQDEYKWHPGKQPVFFRGRIHTQIQEDWFLELKYCSPKLWPPPRNKQHPRNFETDLRKTEPLDTVCCPDHP